MNQIDNASRELLLYSALCVPDIPLPLKLLRNCMGGQTAVFRQAWTELVSHSLWVEISNLGVVLPVPVWEEYRETVSREQTAHCIRIVLKETRTAMQHHSRLAQLAAIRETGPHLFHFAELAERQGISESPYLWQVLGEYLNAVGKFTEAAACLQRALRSPDAPQTPAWQKEIYQSLGKAYQGQQAYPAAEQAYQTALTLGINAHGETDPQVAALVENLGQLAFVQNNFPNAIAYYRRVLEIDQAAQSGDNRIASRWNNLGRVHQAAGNRDQALACFQQAAELWQNDGTGEHHANRALALKNLGVLYQEMGELEKAKASLEAAIQCSEQVYGKDHPDIGRDAGLLAGVLQQLGKYDEAQSLFRRAVQIDLRSFGENHPEVALNLNNLGVLQAQMGKIEEARQTLQHALRILQQCAAPDHPYRQQVEENIRGLQPPSNSIQSKHVSDNS